MPSLHYVFCRLSCIPRTVAIVFIPILQVRGLRQQFSKELSQGARLTWAGAVILSAGWLPRLALNQPRAQMAGELEELRLSPWDTFPEAHACSGSTALNFTTSTRLHSHSEMGTVPIYVRAMCLFSSCRHERDPFLKVEQKESSAPKTH